jgi:hypothetical protein
MLVFFKVPGSVTALLGAIQVNYHVRPVSTKPRDKPAWELARQYFLPGPRAIWGLLAIVQR